MKCYAGIGSRSMKSKNAVELIGSIAALLEEKGYTLRSGGAIGADSAFRNAVEKAQVFLPDDSTIEAEQFASQIHSAWDRCSFYDRKYHGRNVMIILGRNLKEPVDFTLFWTKDETKGGTRTGIMVSRGCGIPNFNLATKDGFKAFTEFYAKYIAGER